MRRNPVTLVLHRQRMKDIGKGFQILLVICNAFFTVSYCEEPRWAEPRPRPENGRTGDKPIRGFVPPRYVIVMNIFTFKYT